MKPLSGAIDKVGDNLQGALNNEASKKGFAQRMLAEIEGEEARKLDLSLLNNHGNKAASRAELESAWHPVDILQEEESTISEDVIPAYAPVMIQPPPTTDAIVD